MMTDLPAGTRIAAYYRCSTDGQEHSVEDQKAVIRKNIDGKGWILAAEYEDEGESGATTDNRAGLLRLLNEVGEKSVDTVLMYDVSRITRGGVGEFWWLVQRFRTHGVQLFCCARQLIANEQNAISFTVDAMQAREENIKRSRDATRGTHQSIFQRDQDPGRRPPLGYDQMRVDIATGKEIERIRFMRDGSKQIMTPASDSLIRIIPKGEAYPKGASLRTVLVPGDPQDVATVQRIFRDAKILGLKRLADSLNREGLTGPKGGNWSPSSLRDILMNPAYLGNRVVNRTSKARYHRHGKDGVVAKDDADAGRIHFLRRAESEWTVWKGKHEALVEEETFNEVQEARDRRQGDKTWNRKGRNQDREYLLSSRFITCRRCGGGLNGTTITSKGYFYPKYYCSSVKHGASICPGYSVPMNALDEFVLDEVRESVTTQDCLEALATGLEREFTRHLELHKPISVDEANALKAEQAEIERARRQLTDAIKSNPAAIEFMKPEIERLTTQSEALKRKQQQAKPSLDKAKIKDLVAKGLAFYQKRILGPLEALAQDKTTMVAGEAEPKKASEEGEDATVKRPEGRPCTAELKELLRLLDVKLTYDPDRKEGTLDFSPFQ